MPGIVTALPKLDISVVVQLIAKPLLSAAQRCVVLLLAGPGPLAATSSAGVLSGALRACQSGNNSLSARGSNTAPDKMCAPTSEPFSSTHTETS